MKVLIYLGHPAHFHLFKETIKILKAKGNEIIIVIKRKDVLEDLLKSAGLNYYNVFPKERKDDKFSIALSLLRRDKEVFKIALKEKPNLMIGTSPEITHVGKLLRVPSIVVNEDDADQVKFFAYFSYPFADTIFVPSSCRVGRWKDKTVFYEGYHELAYLHPHYFTPDKLKIKELFKDEKPFFIIRFAKLTAHHDEGKTGITFSSALKIIETLSSRGNLFITSERELEPEFEKYRIKLHPSLIHHALAFADLY
ncbi:MAG: hypothetical protein ABI550_02455, partial [Ignavibacteriaceae bacterium]